MQEKEKNISPVKRRILQYAKLKGLSKRKIYTETGISNGVLDKESGLSEDNIERFISTYREISPTWLLTGREPMIETNENSNLLNEDQATYIVSKKEQPGVMEQKVDFLKELLRDKDKELAELNKQVGILEERIRVLDSDANNNDLPENGAVGNTA